MNKPFRSCHAPSVLELPDGTLLAVFFAGTHEGSSDQKIYLCRKEPGKEWTKPAAVAHGGGNPSLFLSTSGKLMLFDGWDGRMQTSTDEGKTWSKRRGVCGGCSGPEKNKAVQLEDGTILAPGAGVKVDISKDDGETWTAGKSMLPGSQGGQPTILLYGNSRVQMLFRTAGYGAMGVTWSEDNGKSWSKPGGIILPQNNSGIDGTTLRDGRQLLAYNHSHRNTMGHKGRGILNLAVSKDGKAWDAVLLVNYRIKGGQYSYPAIIQSRNGLIHLVYTWHRQSIHYAVINPKAFKPVPMPDGKWPSSGPLSIEEWKKQNPGWDNINAPDLPK
jgi:predicted neuraminidase